MKAITYTLIILFFSFRIGYSQNHENKLLFSEAVQLNSKAFYQATLNIEKEPQRGNLIFDRFVQHNLTNSYFDNFNAKNLNGALITINNYFKKPMVLNTFASWYIIEKESVLEINTLAEKHHKTIDFVVLFWDSSTNAKKKAKLFNKHVSVVYVNERENIFSKEVLYLKYALHQSLVYYINQEKRIIDIIKNPYHNTSINSEKTVATHTSFSKSMHCLLVDSKNTTQYELVENK